MLSASLVFSASQVASVALPDGNRAAATTQAENPYALLDQLARVLTWIENEYVDPVDRAKLLEGAIEGMVDKLDPHSAYLPREDYAIFQSDTEGRFGGVGVEVDFGEDWVTVIAPIEGSPAERAGMRPGDRIVAIDHSPVRGKSQADLVRRMRGDAGSKVLLTVSRKGAEKYIHFALTREVIKVAAVASKVLTGNVGYLHIKGFHVGTHAQLLEHIGKLRAAVKGAPRGVILDLRNNSGGLVNEASAVADEFLESGVVFTTRRRGQVIDEVRAASGGALRKEPVVVLVNEYTASSAELLGAALQENHRARVVGTPTFGKGSVQTIVDLPGGAGMRLTTLRYYSPLGHAIQAQGIQPDLRPPGVTDDFGVIREKNIEGYLPPEQGASAATEVPPTDPTAVRPEVAAAELQREIPVNPRQGNDVALRMAYELLTSPATASPSRPAAPGSQPSTQPALKPTSKPGP